MITMMIIRTINKPPPKQDEMAMTVPLMPFLGEDTGQRRKRSVTRKNDTFCYLTIYNLTTCNLVPPQVIIGPSC